jgi:putative ABC transport system permease protein
MWSLYRTLSLRFLQRRWSRAALIVASISLGVATLVATNALNDTIWSAAKLATSPLAGAASLVVTNGESGVRHELGPSLAQIPGVRSVEPIIVEQVLLPDLDKDNQPARLVGLDFSTKLQGGENPFGLEVHVASPLAVLSASSLVLLGKELSERLGASLPAKESTFRVLLGGKVHRLSRTDGTVDAHGAAATLGGQVIFMDAKVVARLRGQPGLVNRLDITLEPGADAEPVRREIESAVHGAAFVRTPEANDQSVRDVLAGLQIGFALSGTGALVVGLFLVYNALAVSVTERRFEIGLLRSQGATRGQVWGLFVGEAAFLGLAGAILGIPAGKGLAVLGLGPLQRILNDVLVPIDAQHLQITPPMMLVAAGAGFATALLAAFIPAQRAAQEQPADAIRRIPPTTGLGHRITHLTISLALLGGGSVLIAIREMLPIRWGSYGGLMMVLIGLLLTTPLLADALARLLRPVVQRCFGVEIRLAADNLVRSPGRTGLVITALAAGVAMVLQTSGLIRSNQDPIRSWLKDAFLAQLVVTSGGPITGSGATQPMTEDVRHQIAALPGVEHVVPLRFRNVDYNSTLIFLEAVDSRGFYEAGRRHGIRSDSGSLPRLAEEGTPNIWISENFAALHHVQPGDTIELRGPDGSFSTRVIGTMVDYSWNRGAVLMDRAQFRKHFDDDLVDVFDVYLRPGASAAEVNEVREKMQRSSWGVEHSIVALTHEELQERVSGMIQRIYGVAYAQQGVIGVVAALGVVTSLLISVLQRRRELGLLRAVGATRDQILRTVLAEAALMGFIGALIGLAVGMMLEWYTVRIILFEETGFLFSVQIPWLEAVALSFVSVTLATVAGLGPALHTSRLRIPEAIAYE